jgi:hypothetical protein
MARIYVSYFLNEQVALKAQSKKCNKVLYYKSDKKLPSNPGDIQFISIDINDRRLIDDIFLANKSKLEKLMENSPSFFEYKGNMLLEAINKEFFWSNWVKGLYDYALKTHVDPSDKIIYDDQLNLTFKKGKSFLKAFYRFIGARLSLKSHQSGNKLKSTASFGFYITSSFHVLYYSKLINQLGKDNCVFITNHAEHPEKNIETDGVKVLDTQVNKPSNRFALSFFRNALKYFTIEEFLVLLSVRGRLIHLIEINNFNFDSTINTFFLIAQETSGFGNLTAQMGRKQGKVIVNSHNGIKAADAYNRDNDFTIWCVWDDHMKGLLVDKCHIDPGQLKVVGHFMQDHIADYQYQGSFDDFKNDSGKKVISLFSIPRNLSYKMVVVQTIIDFVENSSNYLLIIRLHPSENIRDWDFVLKKDPGKFKLVIPAKKAFKAELYEQLSISDLSIVFASTVALESAWFGVPCITFEEGDHSALYCADERIIFHVNEIPSLVDKMNTLLNNPYQPEKVKGDVAKRVAELILNMSAANGKG